MGGGSVVVPIEGFKRHCACLFLAGGSRLTVCGRLRSTSEPPIDVNSSISLFCLAVEILGRGAETQGLAS